MRDEYFEWMYKKVCDNRYEKVSFRKLLEYLYDTEFIYFISNDENRAMDGIDLRRRFDAHIYGPCNVLEMMLALAIRIEETITDNTAMGDRTSQWFWGMVSSLGLCSMTDEVFDKEYVSDVIDRFLHREYEPNGKGGLFTIRNCEYDLRDVEIWYQLCWYLDSIYE